MGANSKRRREAKKRKQAANARDHRVGDHPVPSLRPTPFRVPPSADPPRRSERSDRRRAPDDTALATQALAMAIDATRNGNEQMRAAAVDLLAGLPVHGEQHVGATLVEVRVNNALRTMWANGWQPLDVAHVAGRELGAAHREFAVEAIGCEFAAAKHTGVDARWVAQLVRLGALPDTEQPVTLPLFADVLAGSAVSRAGTAAGLANALTLAIELFVLLIRLPRLPELIPPPGAVSNRYQQRPASRLGATASRLDDKILARVRALLAKAEATNFDEEADAFTAKAQELMARHAIDLAMVDAASPNHDTPTARRIHFDDPYAEAKSTLLSVIARENRSNSVYLVGMGFSTLFGFPSDLDIVELLFTSLLTQATHAMLAAGKSVDRSGRSRTRSFRQSFLVAFAYRIGERLGEASAAAAADAKETLGDSFLPVLASRGEAVDEFWKQIFPDTVKRSSTTSNSAGWTAGRQAADRASIHTSTPIQQRG